MLSATIPLVRPPASGAWYKNYNSSCSNTMSMYDETSLTEAEFRVRGSWLIMPSPASNVAPVLQTTHNPALTPIPAGISDQNNTGTLVSDIVGSSITDPNPGDPHGIAVIGANNAQGLWQYSTNGGMTWNGFVGVSSTSAVVLGAAPSDRIRFVPAQGFTGTVSPGVTFRAWDHSDGLADGTTGVDASQGGGESPFSDDIGTATISVVAGRVVLDPIYRYQDSLPRLSWQPVSGAASYEIWFSRLFPAAGRIIHQTGLAGTSFTPAVSLGSGRYRYWVRAIDAAGTSGPWSAFNDFEVRPTLIAPLGTTGSPRPTFTWNAIPLAAGYQIFIRSSAGDQVETGITGTSFTPSADLPSGTIQWWVRAAEAAPYSGWGWSAVGIIGNTLKPTITGPAPPVSGATPTITWTAVAGTARYILNIENAETRAVIIRNDNLTGTSFTPVSALAAGKYRAWVKAIDATSNGIWSEVFYFAIAAAQQASDAGRNDSPGRISDLLLQPLVASAIDHRSVVTSAERPHSEQSADREVAPGDDEALDLLFEPLSKTKQPEKVWHSSIDDEPAMLDVLMGQPLELAGLMV